MHHTPITRLMKRGCKHKITLDEHRVYGGQRVIAARVGGDEFSSNPGQQLPSC